jgi:uncharacterized protein (TIGR03118 family)
MRRFTHELQRAPWSGDRRRRRARRPTVESMEERALLSTLPVPVAVSHPTADHHRAEIRHDLAKHARKPSGYSQLNLVSDLASEGALVTDSNLANSWGLEFSSSSPFWIADQQTGVATIYSVTPLNAVTKSALTVTIPSTSTGTSSSPTGVVFNSSTSDFMIAGPSGTVPAEFIFDTLQGTIVGWNPKSSGGMNSGEIVVNKGSSAVYTGLAIGNSGGQNYLYAANNATGNIDVYNSSFSSVTLAGSFVDPKLTKGFAKDLKPYNITNVGGQLYVTYEGPSFQGGAVAEFNTDGTFVRQIAYNGTRGRLQAPWGVTMAPSSFGKFSNDLLVGNFTSGRINAYNAKGKFVGVLTSNGKKPIVIPDLWSLAVGNGVNGGSTSDVYFTAGINSQIDGLFGVLQPIT